MPHCGLRYRCIFCAGPIPPHCTAVSQRWPLCRCCWARWQGACWQTAAVNKKIMAMLDTVSAIGMAAAAAAMPGAPVTPLVLAALCLLYAVEGLYQPAVQASLPLLLNGAALARGNAVIQLVDTIDELLGPLLGSVLLHTLELRGLLLLCAVCFAVSALWERTLPIPYAPAARSCLRLPPKALFR